MPEYDISLYTNKKMKTNPDNSTAVLQALVPILEGIEDWSVPPIHDALAKLVADLGVKNGQVFYPLRVAVSGKQFTPGGGVELCAILGKEDTLARIRKAIDALSA